MLSGRAIGRLYTLDAEGTVIGRAHDCDIPLDDDGISRVHALIERDGKRWVVRDMGSTNGTFVGDRTVGETPLALRDGDKIRFGTDVIVRFGTQDELERQFLDHLYKAATRDPLTGLANRRLFIERLESEIAWHERHDFPLSVLFIDIDHFKKINDTFGHVWGDRVLEGIAELLREAMRAEDEVCRYGGEEFAVLMRHTNAHHAHKIAERLRQNIAETSFVLDGRSTRVTISVGVTTREGEDMGRPEDFLREADMYMYLAKEQGRNSVAGLQ